MKRFLSFVLIAVVALGITSCKDKKQEDKQQVTQVSTPVVEKPKSIVKTVTINASDCGKVTYYNALFDVSSVKAKIDDVFYIRTTELRYITPKPVELTFTGGKNSLGYKISSDFKAEKIVINEGDNTVWLTGYCSKGYREFVFHGKVKNNGKKVFVNSHWGEKGTVKVIDKPVGKTQLGKN
ncbi:MAG: hypothetical protein R3Y43_00545 [Alphaproteobacteria bacterium]